MVVSSVFSQRAYSGGNEPLTDKSVDYRAFRLQTTSEGIIKIFAQGKK